MGFWPGSRTGTTGAVSIYLDHLTLQSAAGQAVQDAQQAQQDFVLQLYQGMTPEEEQALNQALSRLVKNLKDMEANT